MKNTYFDVTQLYLWEGKLTGIPRVINEYSSRFAKGANKDSNIFVVWDHKGRGFYRVEMDSIIERYLANNNEKNSITYSKSSNLKDKIKALEAKSTIIHRIISIARRLLHIYRNSKTNNEPRNEYIELQSQETICIFWGDWSDQNYIKTLKDFHDDDGNIIQFAHDMIPVIQPQYSGHSTESLNNFAINIYPICHRIIAVSENTKRDVINWMKAAKLNIPDIVVINSGDDFNVAKPQQPLSITKVGKYILCVGTVELRKNHLIFYYIYNLARLQGLDLPDLIIVGRHGWKTEGIIDLLSKTPFLRNKVHILDQINDNELSWLYKNCLFTVYPSYYEGWGLPIAESINYGKTCLSSNTSSMPEIAGDLINYFNPYSPEDCLKEILKLLDPDILAKAEKLLKNYKSRTWDDSYNKLNTVIESIDD